MRNRKVSGTDAAAGKFGNKLDAKAGKDLVADSDDDESGSDSDAGDGPRKGLMQQKKREEAGVCCNHSVTEPCCMQSIDRRYGFVPINSTKPCLYTVCMFEDFRKRHFHSNILNRINEDLVTIITSLLLLIIVFPCNQRFISSALSY